MSPTTFLADESWLPCFQHAVALAFLCAEWGKVPMFGDRRIVDDPDLTDAVENNVRALLFWSIREPLLRLIPANTQWFEVKHLRECHFAQLRAINHPVWNSPDDLNELEKVAARKPESLRGPAGTLVPAILWGHNRQGPFTIIEGNHRMSALAGSNTERGGCTLPVFAGLSAELCVWHLPDVPALRAQG